MKFGDAVTVKGTVETVGESWVQVYFEATCEAVWIHKDDIVKEEKTDEHKRV